VAADPLIAFDQDEEVPPRRDPVWIGNAADGRLTFLEKLMSQNPVPVVVCSGLTGPRTEAAIRALEIGAVDIITKPQVGVRGFLEESAVLLEDTVRARRTARVTKFRKLRKERSSYHTADVVIPPSCPVFAGAAQGQSHRDRRVHRRYRSAPSGFRTDATRLPGNCGSPAYARGIHGSFCEAS